MKRSFLMVAAASVFVLGACNGRDTDTQIEPVEEVGPPPAPAPAPMPLDTAMYGDTLPLTPGTPGTPEPTTGE